MPPLARELEDESDHRSALAAIVSAEYLERFEKEQLVRTEKEVEAVNYVLGFIDNHYSTLIKLLELHESMPDFEDRLFEGTIKQLSNFVGRARYQYLDDALGIHSTELIENRSYIEDHVDFIIPDHNKKNNGVAKYILSEQGQEAYETLENSNLITKTIGPRLPY
ncbi:hypothetical protein GOV04_05325 [Candidatus Woesearchaeota archaeon]|nr:hypothetical protein [Candidatus Woesearchaeota archaeon]